MKFLQNIITLLERIKILSLYCCNQLLLRMHLPFIPTPGSFSQNVLLPFLNLIRFYTSVELNPCIIFIKSMFHLFQFKSVIHDCSPTLSILHCHHLCQFLHKLGTPLNLILFLTWHVACSKCSLQLTLELHGFEVHRSIYTRTFKKLNMYSTACEFPLPHGFLNNIFLSLHYSIIRIQYIIPLAYKICVN